MLYLSLSTISKEIKYKSGRYKAFKVCQSTNTQEEQVQHAVALNCETVAEFMNKQAQS